MRTVNQAVAEGMKRRVTTPAQAYEVLTRDLFERISEAVANYENHTLCWIPTDERAVACFVEALKQIPGVTGQHDGMGRLIIYWNTEEKT